MDERRPLEAALAAYTSGDAWQAFEDTAGTITLGKRADLTLLGAEVPALDDSELASVPVRDLARRGAGVRRMTDTAEARLRQSWVRDDNAPEAWIRRVAKHS